MFNWPDVLEGDALAERLSLAGESQYICGSYMAQALRQKHPRLDHARYFGLHAESNAGLGVERRDTDATRR
jgi:hypothetical protein